MWRACAILILLTSCSPKNTDTVDINRQLADIRYNDFHSYLAALSSDDTEGRGAGTRGYDKAASHAAIWFQDFNLEPAGDSGTWYQQVNFIRSRRVDDSFAASISIGGKTIPLRLNEDIVVRPMVTTTETLINDVPLVFAGYGIDAPELDYDDYDGIDVRGKIVAVSLGAPKTFNNEAAAIYTFDKQRMAFDHGAIGVIQLAPDYMRFPFAVAVRFFTKTISWVDSEGHVAENHAPLNVAAHLAPAIAEKLFTRAGKNLNDVVNALHEGTKSAFDLNATVSIRQQYVHDRFESSNVAALLKGNDETLQEEVVVVTAHLDHLGIGPPADNDSIYNGTMDNASGSAALLTLAQAFGKNRNNKRTILFLLVTAEENGLLGSGYFAHNPTPLAGHIVANHNIDGLDGMIIRTTDVLPYGYAHSNLSTSVDFGLNALHLTVGTDPHPEQGFFVRSDQYSFIKHAIPAIFLFGGQVASDSTLDASARAQAWFSNRYHQPSDDLQQPIDTLGAVQDLKLHHLILYHMTTRSDTIRWNEGSYLFEKFGGSRK